MSHIILLFWAGLMGFVLYLSWQVIKTNQKLQPAKANKHRNNYKNHPLWYELKIKCRGDEDTAKRLISYLQRKHPGNSPNWYLEKAIRDLERDNRY